MFVPILYVLMRTVFPNLEAPTVPTSLLAAAVLAETEHWKLGTLRWAQWT
jgi:hypothetical protein